MARRLVQQPNGKLAVWSSIVDNVILYNASPQNVVDMTLAEALEDADRDGWRWIEGQTPGRRLWSVDEILAETVEQHRDEVRARLESSDDGEAEDVEDAPRPACRIYEVSDSADVFDAEFDVYTFDIPLDRVEIWSAILGKPDDRDLFTPDWAAVVDRARREVRLEIGRALLAWEIDEVDPKTLEWIGLAGVEPFAVVAHLAHQVATGKRPTLHVQWG